MTLGEVLKLCDAVTSHSEEFLLEIGCRKRTSNKHLPYLDSRRVLIPYGNKPTDIMANVQPLISHELAKLASPGVVKEPGDIIKLTSLLKIIALGNPAFERQRPRKRIKVLEIPREVAEKLLVLGM